MAGTKVRGITIELSADASGISKELGGVNKSIASTSRELKDIDKLLKLDPSNVQLLAQKHEALQRQVEQTREKMRLLRDAEEDLKKQMVDGGTEEQKKQLAALQREIISTENSLDGMESQLNQTEKETKDLTKAEQQATHATSEMSGGFTVLKGALASLAADGIRAALDGFKDLIKAGPEYADEILTMAKTTSLATDTLQELSYMSDLVDVDVNTVAGSMKKLTKNMASAQKGSGSAYDAFTKLGVSFTDVNGQLRDNEDVFYDTIDALGKMQNETERDATAMAIFGKSATDLNPMIEAGAGQLKAFADEAHNMGYVLDEDALEALGRVQDEFDRFGKQMEAVKNQIAAGVAPAIERGMKKLSDVVQKIDWKKVGDQMGKAFDKLIDGLEWIVDHGTLVKSLLTGVVSAMAAQKVMKFVSSISAMTSALQTATMAQEGMNAAANANPYVALASVFVALIAAVVAWSKSAGDAYWAETDLGKETQKLDEIVAQHAENTREMVEAYESMDSVRSASITSAQAEAEHLQTLTNELGTLVDENGKVADADKARADFILNELNGALGTEYSLNDLLNGKYIEMRDNINQLIEAKRAEVIMAAQEEAYGQAVAGRADAEAKLSGIVKDQIQLERDKAAAEQRRDELNKQLEGRMNARLEGERDRLNEQIAMYEEHATELEENYRTQAETVNKYAYDIEQYESNWEKAHEGHYDQIETVSYDTMKEMGHHVDNYAQKVADDTRAAEGDFDHMSTHMKTAAKQIGQGVADGINEGAGPAYTAMSAFGNNLLTKFKQTMEIKSPSKKMQENAKFMVDGVVIGIKNNEKNAIAAVGEMGNKMSDAFKSSFNIGSALNGSNLSLLNVRHLADVASANSTNNFTQNIYAPQQPSRIELYRQTRNLLAAAGRL